MPATRGRSEGRLQPQRGRWTTEGRGELRFDSETPTRNEQNQVRASLERLCERLAEW
jgi:hypothetical protein